ncbi:GntR family transcriptional regulator [Nocardioides albus]|uniref:DNA-binding GntR family transcriptional regulator n=1 Tax=Nocardioides albus TaxID=1841 RepID=A0A7W5F964_9ACTN|nr:GntR family transcriptional regulator [Nocardioides albus]MBB3089726.1 DNA-binding GntR family transcriptional regulator [Nocardioides albus]GGU35163.1 hypothetical protein GCM10007979_37700 [Nocardioides albus]
MTSADGSGGTPLRVSAPDRIVATLRADLLNGNIAPGEHLREEQLTARFDAGRHTVRAAIKQLAATGLVIHERHKGAHVPELTRERIDTVFEFRSVVELGSLRIALRRHADLSPVEYSVRRLESLPEDTPWGTLIEAHGRIHRAIVEASGNQRLVEAHQSCEDELRLLLANLRPDFTVAKLAGLHRDLMDKLLIDDESAVAALRDDLEHAGRGALLMALQRQQH